jgi:hypothetical protein
MNRKQAITLILAVAVIGGAGLLVYNKRSQSWEASGAQLGGKVVKDFPINDVEQIRIKQHTGEVNLARKNDVWVVQERNGYPANFDNISDFLRKVHDLKMGRAMRVTDKQLGRLELTAPDKGTNAGTLVEFKDKGGKTIALTLGKKDMKEGGGGQFGGGAWPSGRYVMVGNDPKTVGLVSEPFANIEPKAEEWVDKEFFKIENHKSIAVTGATPTNTWTVAKESATNEWKLADAKAKEELDSGKASSVTSALSYPSFSDVAVNATPDKTGLDKPTVAKIETFDGFRYEVKLGKKLDDRDDHYMQVAVSGNFAKERTPGKDEKPEDKEKLDKEFKDKLAKHEEKLKSEKRFEQWVYTVPKYTVEPLLKGRQEFLKEEPKAEEKKEDTTSSSSPESKPTPPTPGDSLVPKIAPATSTK